MANETNGFSAGLLRIFEAIGGALAFEQALHAIMERMQEVVRHQSVAAVTVSGEFNELRIINSRRISYSFTKQFARRVRGDLLPRVLLKHETIALNAAGPKTPDYAEVRLEHDFRSLCLAPIMRQQRAVGYVHCDRAEPDGFSPEEIVRLRLVGCLIGLLMEKFEFIELSQHLDRIDAVSKALKYHAFVEEYYRELARAREYRLPLSLLFLSLNNFIRYVSVNGIAAGHALLANLRDWIAESVRPMDVVGRFSAVQFIVCMNGVERAAAFEALEKIARRVRESAKHSGKTGVSATGVCMTLERPGEYELPLEKVLAALGSGLIVAHHQDANQLLAIDPPRKE